MFDKLKLKPYLLTIFSILIVLAGIIAISGILGLQHTKRNTDRMVNQILAANSAVKECRIAANTAGRNLREMVLAEDPYEIAAFESSINDNIQMIEEQIQVFQNVHGVEDGLAQRYEAAFQDWFRIAQEVMDEAKAGNWDLARETILHKCSPSMTELASIAQEIDTITAQEEDQQEHNTLVMLNVYMVVLVVVFLLALMVSIS